ncbi:MAG TPA: methyltransferase domain-containing protein [Candidatus Acidoferrales bacterium]|nr:methyltransferase domain-containing protein [Candidatus Acidoferrales bacterium]
MGLRNFPRRFSSARGARLALVCVLLSFGGCATLKRCAYEGIGRDGWQQPERVIESLDLKPGARVADLGSGGGYFTFRLARAVGPEGKVYAVDIDEALNRDLSARAQRQGYQNIEIVQARADDPLLPPAGVDLIFTSNTYHHLAERVRYFANARKYLSPNGRVAIIDFNEQGWIESLGHYTPAEVIKKEMAAAGYELKREFKFLAKQNFLIFGPKT